MNTTVEQAVLNRLLPLAESPIEIKMLRALAALIDQESQSRFALIARSPFEWHKPTNGTLLSQPVTAPAPFDRMQTKGIAISAQVRVGSFRADFAIQKVYLKGGEWSFGSTVFIECDGHAFHNLNDEQRARDLARDEAIQQLVGVSILRLRGFEIWRQADACAAKALDELDMAAAGYAGGPWRVVGLESLAVEEEID